VWIRAFFPSQSCSADIAHTQSGGRALERPPLRVYAFGTEAGVEGCSDRVKSAVNRGQQKPDGGSRKSVDSSNAGMEDEVQVLLEQSRILAQVAQLEMDRTRLVVEAHGKDCPMQEKILGETIVARANPAHFEWSILSSDADDVPISPHMVEAKLYNQKPRSRRGSALRAGWVAMIQGPACVKERERKIATIQNQCWLRGVESLELQKVARPAASESLSPALDTDAQNFRSPRETTSALQSAPSSPPRRLELHRVDEHIFTSLSSRCSPVATPPSSQSEYKTSQARAFAQGLAQLENARTPDGVMISLNMEMDDIIGREVAFADKLSAHVTQSLELTDARVAPRWVKVTSFRCKPFRAHVAFASSESCRGKGGGISNSEAAFRLHLQATQLASPLRTGEMGQRIRGVEILHHDAPVYYSEESQVHSHVQEARERDEGRNRSQEARKKNEEAEARKLTSQAVLPQLKCKGNRDDEDVLGASLRANLAKDLNNLEIGDKLAKATGDLGKNLGKAGEKLIKVWDLNDLKDDAVEMKEHLLNAQASANQARSEGFSHGTPMNLKLRGLSSSRSPKEEHTRRQGEEEKRELKEEAAARRRFLAALVGLRLDTSEDEAAPRKVRVRACVGSLCAVRVCLCGCKCVRVCLWGGGGAYVHSCVVRVCMCVCARARLGVGVVRRGSDAELSLRWCAPCRRRRMPPKMLRMRRASRER